MKLFVIDWSWFLYRAYYAFPPLTDKDGHNTNVVYWFFRMMFKIFQEKPDYLVIAWDAPVKTIRHDTFPEYKANRKKMDDDFRHQIPVTKEIVAELGIPFLSVDGYEADDIIASLVRKHQNEPDMLIDIYSSDKDLKQLLKNNVFAVDPLKGITTDTKLFLQEFLFEPKYILDYLALTGDSSDNIKWIAGIGPKQASELIKKYQDLDGIYAHIDEITGGLKQKLIDGKEDAYWSKNLIQLHTVPGVETMTLDQFVLSLDFGKMKEILVKRYGFQSFEKVIDEMKKKMESPVQMGLF